MSGTLSLYGTSTQPVQITDRERMLCVANPRSRGAGCGSPARPDPWGTWAGNRPGLPDSPLLQCGSGSCGFDGASEPRDRTSEEITASSECEVARTLLI